MLTSIEIANQIKKGNIEIGDLLDNTFEKPNSCIVSIGDVLYTFDNQIIDTKKQNNHSIQVLSDCVDSLKKITIPKEGLLLEPGKTYLTKTSEKIKTYGYIPVLNGLSSLSLLGLGITLTCESGEDSFDGKFLLSIVCTKPIWIYPNIEIGNLTFFKSLDFVDHSIGMLSGEEIKRRMETGEIVITPNDNIVINPNSVNLSLYNTLGFYTEKTLDLKKKNPIQYVKITESGIILPKNELYFARTNEWTETNNLVPMLSGRSSLGRLGFHAHCTAGMGSIGYKGYWHLGLKPTESIKIYPNMKCCQIYYYTCEGDVNSSYHGDMQNLRTMEGSQYYKRLKK